MAPLRKIDIERECKENTKLKREDLTTLRKHANKCYARAKLSDLDLFLFLHSNYYDVEKARKAVDAFVSFRTNWPYLFVNVFPGSEPKNFQIENILIWPLERKSVKNYKVFFMRINEDATTYDYDDHMKLFIYITQLFLAECGNEEGFSIVIDFKQFSWRHMSKIKLGTLRRMVKYVQEAFSIRLMEIHLINSWAVVDKLMYILKMFMNKELYDLMNTHTTMETFYQYVPQVALPKDYGGDDLTVVEMHEKMVQHLTDTPNFFREFMT